MSLDDAALEVFIDYRIHPPLVINANSNAIEAEQLLLLSTLPVVVIDRDGSFVGLLTNNELNEHEIIKRISQGFSRTELKVRDFMRAKDVLKAFFYEDVARSTIAGTITALKENGQRECLVVDHKTHEIVGLICASEIESRLQHPIHLDGKTSTEKLTRTIYKQIHLDVKLKNVM